MIITSRANKTAKLITSLSHKKYRDETGLFVVEGKRWVDDALAYAPASVRTVIASPSCAEEYPGAVVFSDELLSSVCETVTSQGVAAILEKPRPRAEIGELILFLDGIRDPGNLGTLIRTACAAGFNDIFLRGCTDAYSGKAVRSTMSALLKINLRDGGIDDLVRLKENGCIVVGADMSGKSLFELPAPRGKVCIVIGGEADGITDEAAGQCDVMSSIPMTGDIESLNAAVSGAIMMYETIRKRIFEK